MFVRPAKADELLQRLCENLSSGTEDHPSELKLELPAPRLRTVKLPPALFTCSQGISLLMVALLALLDWMTLHVKSAPSRGFHS